MFNAFGNATQVPPANWRNEPATRGTWNILSSCLITLGLCLWTALHLNIPRHKEGAWLPQIRKTGWLLLGLLAPEMLAYTAWYQRQAAHKLNAVMQRKLGQRKDSTCAQRLAVFFKRCCHCNKRKQGGGHENEMSAIELDERETNDNDVKHGESDRRSSAASRRHTWTTAHSFYALMGGFVFDTSDEDVNFLPNSRKRLTLTPSGLLYILEHEPDLIPNISKEHICDKSKASNLAKTLVCLQALWFCVQCIVRLAQGHAISLLELNVFGHAVCALLMYLLWWDKPLDIEEPTVLSGNMAREMCALMCMRSFSGDADFAFLAPSDGGQEMDLPELPYGVRYGSQRRRNVAETSVTPNEKDAKIIWYWAMLFFSPWLFLLSPLSLFSKLLPGYGEIVEIPIRPSEDQGKKKWYRLDKIVVNEALDTWYDIMVAFGRKPPRLVYTPTILECRLEWTATSLLDTKAERFCPPTAYPVPLDYPDAAMGTKDWTMRHALPSVPEVTAREGTHTRHTSRSSIQQPIQPGPSVTMNYISIDGFCLTLGRWPKRDTSYGIIKADVFVPRRLEPDYAPAFVTLSHADVIRWRLCARALQQYCPQPRWVLISGTPSHQDFPAHRSVYDRSPNWPSSQHLGSMKDDENQSLAIWLGFSFAGLVYGGLHLLAWDAPFPSHFQDMLWRSSGALLASSGFICTLFFLVAGSFFFCIQFVESTSFWQYFKIRLNDLYKPLMIGLFVIVIIPASLLVGGFVIVYVAARGYLVLESFLQLVHLPDSAYTLPKYSQYFPHIT